MTGYLATGLTGCHDGAGERAPCRGSGQGAEQETQAAFSRRSADRWKMAPDKKPAPRVAGSVRNPTPQAIHPGDMKS